MTRLICPSPTFIVLTSYRRTGFGGAGDPTDSYMEAYNQYADAVAGGQSARVFRMDFDPDTNELETTRDITSDVHDEYERICEERGLNFAEAAE